MPATTPHDALWPLSTVPELPAKSAPESRTRQRARLTQPVLLTALDSDCQQFPEPDNRRPTTRQNEPETPFRNRYRYAASAMRKQQRPAPASNGFARRVTPRQDQRRQHHAAVDRSRSGRWIRVRIVSNEGGALIGAREHRHDARQRRPSVVRHDWTSLDRFTLPSPSGPTWTSVHAAARWAETSATCLRNMSAQDVCAASKNYIQERPGGRLECG